MGVFPSHRLLRTRKQELIDTADFVVDVGGVWDAAKGRFDHHQRGFDGARPASEVDGTIVPIPQRVPVIDSSGAGDAFNGGYLHARLAGATPVDAALAGHRLAGWNIGRRGAIPARDGDAPY
ncbi:MAG: MYG1 family protein [Sphingobium sp.]|nr:MYG1 family protein [Sphingobium sp.]